MVVAIVIGTPLGLLLFLTGRGGLKENVALNQVVGYLVNVLRSFPFIVLMVVIIPVTRLIVGTSIGPRATAVGLSCRTPRSRSSRGWSNRACATCRAAWAMPALVSSLTVTAISFIAYSAVAGAIGAGGIGGIGDLAIRFGYYRFETGVMVWCVILMYLLVQIARWVGSWAARRVDKR